jgi:succinate dehydrogenase / fumarate reductase cytochrome b subunit
MSTSPLPGDASNDPTDDQSGRFVRQPNGRVRPLSPHLQVWRWHVTMLASILVRVSGGALAVGALFVVAWLAALAFGPDAYATFSGWMGSPPGLLVWIGLTAALAYHFAGGVRHLVWDAGAGLTPKTANVLSTASIAFAVVVTVAFWAGLFMTGRVVL